MGLVNFFTNNSDEQKAAATVEAPAFSLTKVLAAGAVLITPVVTLLVDEIAELNLTEWNWVALAIGVLGFLAITASADVLARATAERAKVAQAALGQLLPFDAPLNGRRQQAGADADVKVLAASQGPSPYFLVKEGEDLKWLPAAEVTIS